MPPSGVRRRRSLSPSFEVQARHQFLRQNEARRIADLLELNDADRSTSGSRLTSVTFIDRSSLLYETYNIELTPYNT